MTLNARRLAAGVLRTQAWVMAGLVMVAIGQRGWAQDQGGPPPAPVRVDAATQQQVQERRLVTGALRAVHRSRVAAEEPGLVREIPIEEGRSLRKGETIARLDSARLEIERRQARADRLTAQALVAEREAELQWRQHELQNHQALAQGGAGRAKELFDAEMAVRTATARLESARAGVEMIAAREDLLNKRIDDTVIVAPFDGVIVARLAEAGEWVAEGAAVAEIIATAAVDAWLDVPQQYAHAILGKSTTVMINIEATGAQIDAAELRTIPQVDPKARTFALVARLDNAQGNLAPGMSVTGWAPTGELAERLTISRDAVMRNAVGTFVYVARQTQPGAPLAAMPADVQVLFGHGERLVVNAPMLKPGDLLVIEGNERLFPTAPIMPQSAEAPKRRNSPRRRGRAASLDASTL